MQYRKVLSVRILAKIRPRGRAAMIRRAAANQEAAVERDITPKIIKAPVEIQSWDHDNNRRNRQGDPRISCFVFYQGSKETCRKCTDESGSGRRHSCKVHQFQTERIGNRSDASRQTLTQDVPDC